MTSFNQYLHIIILSIFLINISMAKEPITPIPKTILYNHTKAKIGKRLFFDPGLSKDGSIACVSCHSTENGAEHTKVSRGINGSIGSKNAPTVFNSVFNFRQMWNGSDKNLKEQADGPINNPVEMGSSKKHVVQYVKSVQWYRKEFRTLYGDRDIKYEDILDAIAEFEKTLITPDCKFDKYLRGETKLSEDEQKGYELFKKLGCITCHNGINIGGNSFQKIGLINPYPWNNKAPDRYSVTHNPFDKNIYKVPTLRNIALTAPYFHDGSSPTLDDVLEKMAYYNLGFKLNSDEIIKLKAFLNTLTGKKPETFERDIK